MVEQRLVQTSWASNTLTTLDTLTQRHRSHIPQGTLMPGGGGAVPSGTVTVQEAAANICYPLPVCIRFTPTKSRKYTSRFRFTCDYGNAFDVLLQGEGTYEEHEHAPLFPVPRE